VLISQGRRGRTGRAQQRPTVDRLGGAIELRRLIESMDEQIGESDIQWMQVQVQRHGEMGGLVDVDTVEVEEAIMRDGCGSDILEGYRRKDESGITWNDELEGVVGTRRQIQLSSLIVEDGQ
jgi:hypothetical protein